MMRLLWISLWNITPSTHLFCFFLLSTSKYIGVFGRFLLGINSSPPRWSCQYSTFLLIVPKHHQYLIILERPSCNCREGLVLDTAAAHVRTPFLFPRASHEPYAGPWGEAVRGALLTVA